jgi:2-hydroxycyclohexanecarboxyl-CoA dehydrogenase
VSDVLYPQDQPLRGARLRESGTGRIALVTGPGSGLGRAIALRLGAEGFEVAVTDIDRERGAAVVAEIEDPGGQALFLECDVGDVDSVRAARDGAIEALGGVDCLVNNAGFDTPDFFLQTDPASWEPLIRVNLIGVLNCIHAMGPAIAERCRGSGYGRIVSIASDAGRVGSLGEAVYSAAKGGVIAFTKSMARELARDGVTVNAVCPGPADTPMTDAIRSTELGRKMMERMVAATPLRRLGDPAEVAAAVAYLAGDEARFITGQALSVSGGLTMAD